MSIIRPAAWSRELQQHAKLVAWSFSLFAILELYSSLRLASSALLVDSLHNLADGVIYFLGAQIQKWKLFRSPSLQRFPFSSLELLSRVGLKRPARWLHGSSKWRHRRQDWVVEHAAEAQILPVILLALVSLPYTIPALLQPRFELAWPDLVLAALSLTLNVTAAGSTHRWTEIVPDDHHGHSTKRAMIVHALGDGTASAVTLIAFIAIAGWGLSGRLDPIAALVGMALIVGLNAQELGRQTRLRRNYRPPNSA